MSLNVRTKPMSSKRILALFVVALATGCEAADQATLEFSNGPWAIRVIGQIQHDARWLETSTVRFEALRDGTLYARGSLYEAGFMDRAFLRQYPRAEWVASNALHMFGAPAKDVPRIVLVVKNDADTPLKWIRIRSEELFLVLDVRRNESVQLMTWQWADMAWFVVEGEWADGSPLERQTLRDPTASTKLDLTIGDAVTLSPSR
jgi:hypothetical protein